MNLQEKLEKMESCRGRNHPLPVFRSWLEEKQLIPQGRMVQIAGTNGKGSVIRWLELMLENEGYIAGCFTSPHLQKHFERITLNQNPVPDSIWEEIYDLYAPFFDEKEMTMFEMDLWMALAYFRQSHPDFMLMEVGMGGERDATTALDYDLSLITNIGLDHMAYLGNTKEEIARAKAGIIQEKTPVLTTEKDPACLAVFEQKAEEKKAHLEKIPRWEGTWDSSLPDYQKENFALAAAAFAKLGFENRICDSWAQEIQEQFSWPGRFMVLRKDPLLVLDGAHNLPGIEALCRSIAPGQFMRVYFSVLADKQGREMIERLQEKGLQVILVDFDSYRIADLEQLAKEQKLPLISLPFMMEELEDLKEPALICGSLYFAGDVLQLWQDLGELPQNPPFWKTSQNPDIRQREKENKGKEPGPGEVEGK